MGFIYNSCYCSVCAKEFVDANTLSDHERQVHKEENLYCKICGKLETNPYTPKWAYGTKSAGWEKSALNGTN